MKIYDSRTAPNPRRVRIFLAEKGVDVEYVPIDIMKSENKSDEFKKIHALGLLPVLELDDGTCIPESVAICRYFEETHPDPPLMGTDAKDKAVVESWQRLMENEVFIPIAQVFRNTHMFFKGRIEQVPEYGEACRRVAEKRLAWLNDHLADNEFIAGDNFTIADITAMVALDFGKVTGFKIGDDQENLARWYKAVSSRPSAKA